MNARRGDPGAQAEAHAARTVPKIVVLNGNHLCHNPRVLKEASALAEAGMDVEILGAWFDRDLAARDLELARGQAFRYTPVFEFFPDGGRRTASGLAMRAEASLALKAVRWLDVQSPSALGYGVRRMLRAARSRRADLFIAHSESTLWVACELARAGRAIAVDMEDWFSNDYVAADRPFALIARLEKAALDAAAHATCTSHAMSAALREAYGCEPPTVIYNVFPWAERARMDGLTKDRRDRSRPSLHWFSQNVGPARGLEHLFAALPHLAFDVEVHLRGAARGANLAWLENAVPPEWRPRVFVHPVVGNDSLLSRIAEHDIGLALDVDVPVNRDVTVTNKMLQYLQAGLAVVAASTSGQREIAERAPGAVELYDPRDARTLAARIDELLASRERLAAARAAALEAARATFCWERVAPILVQGVADAVRRTRAPVARSA